MCGKQNASSFQEALYIAISWFLRSYLQCNNGRANDNSMGHHCFNIDRWGVLALWHPKKIINVIQQRFAAILCLHERGKNNQFCFKHEEVVVDIIKVAQDYCFDKAWHCSRGLNSCS